MKLSETGLKWLMNLYPPLLIQRIWVKKVHKGFRGMDVKINRALVTTNVGNSTFGGTLFSATDPFYAMLFGQIMRHKGINVTVWLKSAEIQYLKPAYQDLFYTITITNEMVAEVEQAIKTDGKFVKTYPIDIYNKSGELCVKALNEVYIRDLDFYKND